MIPSLAQWNKDPMLLLLWHSHSLSLIRPLAWELPYATGAAPPPKKILTESFLAEIDKHKCI